VNLAQQIVAVVPETGVHLIFPLVSCKNASVNWLLLTWSPIVTKLQNHKQWHWYDFCTRGH